MTNEQMQDETTLFRFDYEAFMDEWNKLKAEEKTMQNDEILLALPCECGHEHRCHDLNEDVTPVAEYCNEQCDCDGFRVPFLYTLQIARELAAARDREGKELERLREMEMAVKTAYFNRHDIYSDDTTAALKAFGHLRALGRYFPQKAYDEFKEREALAAAAE